jgi:hypothetical protein
MKTRANRSSHVALVSSTFGTTLLSILAAWVVSSIAFAPVSPTPDVSHSNMSHHLYQISPIPPGADWAA